MPADTPRLTRFARWRRILLFQAVLLILGLLLAEAGMRVWRRVRGDPFDADGTATRIALMRSRATDLVPIPRNPNEGLKGDDEVQAQILHPYTGAMILGTLQNLDAELARISDPQCQQDFEILLCGGSVSAIFGHFGRDRLIELLQADPLFANRRIYLYGYGIGGFKQPQTTNLANYLFTLGFTPECVIAIDGFNEVALGNTNASLGTNPTYPSVTHWGALTDQAAPDHETTRLAWNGFERQAAIVALADRALAWGAHHSVIAGTIVLGRLDRLEAEAHASFDAYTKRQLERSKRHVRAGPPFPAGPEAAVELSVNCWKENSRTLRALCEARGVPFLHFLQPTLHDVGSKRLTKPEIDAGGALDTWIEGVRIGYPRLRKAGAELRAGGENFIDATQLFADQPGDIYFDNCHFNRLGNYLLANLVAAEVLKAMKAAAR